MPKVKVLKGVAHNIGSSFTSLMNYAVDDYCLGHILRFARASGYDTLTIDLLDGQGGPKALLQEPITELPDRYSKMFLRLVHSAGSDRQLIEYATLRLTYNLNRNRSSPIPGEPESPYTCAVSVATTQGKVYESEFDGWWFVERTEANAPSNPIIRVWWNPLTWFR